MQRRLIYAPEAADDLERLRGYIAERSGAQRALGYIDRIMAACDKLTTFPERGRKRDDLRPGLRIVGFERRVAIAFHVTDTVFSSTEFYMADATWEPPSLRTNYLTDGPNHVHNRTIARMEMRRYTNA